MNFFLLNVILPLAIIVLIIQYAIFSFKIGAKTAFSSKAHFWFMLLPFGALVVAGMAIREQYKRI